MAADAAQLPASFEGWPGPYWALRSRSTSAEFRVADEFGQWLTWPLAGRRRNRRRTHLPVGHLDGYQLMPTRNHPPGPDPPRKDMPRPQRFSSRQGLPGSADEPFSLQRRLTKTSCAYGSICWPQADPKAGRAGRSSFPWRRFCREPTNPFCIDTTLLLFLPELQPAPAPPSSEFEGPY